MTNERKIQCLKTAYMLKRAGLLQNLTLAPQTIGRICGNLSHGKHKTATSFHSHKGAILKKAAEETGFVQKCDKMPTEKGHGGLITYAATPLLLACGDFLKTRPVLSFNQLLCLNAVANGMMRASEIASETGVPYQTALMALTALFKLGLVEAEKQPVGNFLAWHWRATDAGREWLKEFENIKTF